MNWLRLHRAESRLQRVPRRIWHLACSVLAATSALLFLAVLLANFQRSFVVTLLSVAFPAAIFALFFLLLGFSRLLRREQRETATELETTAQELEQMADNIQEISWTIDARSQNAIYANQAYEIITGRSLQSLKEKPSSYKERQSRNVHSRRQIWHTASTLVSGPRMIFRLSRRDSGDLS